MCKKDNIKFNTDEIYSDPRNKNKPTNRIEFNHPDEISSVDLLDMSD